MSTDIYLLFIFTDEMEECFGLLININSLSQCGGHEKRSVGVELHWESCHCPLALAAKCNDIRKCFEETSGEFAVGYVAANSASVFPLPSFLHLLFFTVSKTASSQRKNFYFQSLLSPSLIPNATRRNANKNREMETQLVSNECHFLWAVC